MVRYSPHRTVYLNRLIKLTKIGSGVTHTTEAWWRRRLHAYDLLFMFLYGLPQKVQLSPVLAAVSRYLPNYEARYPSDKRPRRLVEVAKQWISSPLKTGLSQAEWQLGGFGRSEGHEHFLGALDCLVDLLLARKDEPLWTAAKSTRIIQWCIYQRVEDVWMADDPEAVLSWNRAQQILCELGSTEDSVEWHEIMERVAAARRLDVDNVACWAVERREWYILVEWLSPIAEMYPDSLRPSARELNLWREDTWDISEQDPP